jgi:hypothetical protein
VAAVVSAKQMILPVWTGVNSCVALGHFAWLVPLQLWVISAAQRPDDQELRKSVRHVGTIFLLNLEEPGRLGEFQSGAFRRPDPDACMDAVASAATTDVLHYMGDSHCDVNLTVP